MFGDEMPKPGFTKITVSDSLKALLKRIAEVKGLSMPGLILMMAETQYPEHLADEAGKEKEK